MESDYTCVVPGCNSDVAKIGDLVNHPWMRHVRFFKFPASDDSNNSESAYKLRQKWINAVNKYSGWQPDCKSHVCSMHFSLDKPTLQRPVPDIFPWGQVIPHLGDVDLTGLKEPVAEVDREDIFNEKVDKPSHEEERQPKKVIHWKSILKSNTSVPVPVYKSILKSNTRVPVYKSVLKSNTSIPVYKSVLKKPTPVQIPCDKQTKNTEPLTGKIVESSSTRTVSNVKTNVRVIKKQRTDFGIVTPNLLSAISVENSDTLIGLNDIKKEIE